jgi:hypothetical protein
MDRASMAWTRGIFALRHALPLVLLALLAACASQAPSTLHTIGGYPAPGPPGDPWGPYIAQASTRFGVSTGVIRAVIQKESRGNVRATSASGARGLMQLMPATYARMRREYGLGADPYNPRDNILAGTAYLHEMARTVGPANMLAAYNAGPVRVVLHEQAGVPLPNETQAYIGQTRKSAGTGQKVALRQGTTRHPTRRPTKKLTSHHHHHPTKTAKASPPPAPAPTSAATATPSPTP